MLLVSGTVYKMFTLLQNISNDMAKSIGEVPSTIIYF